MTIQTPARGTTYQHGRQAVGATVARPALPAGPTRTPQPPPAATQTAVIPRTPRPVAPRTPSTVIAAFAATALIAAVALGVAASALIVAAGH